MGPGGGRGVESAWLRFRSHTPSDLVPRAEHNIPRAEWTFPPADTQQHSTSEILFHQRNIQSRMRNIFPRAETSPPAEVVSACGNSTS